VKEGGKEEPHFFRNFRTLETSAPGYLSTIFEATIPIKKKVGREVCPRMAMTVIPPWRPESLSDYGGSLVGVVNSSQEPSIPEIAMIPLQKMGHPSSDSTCSWEGLRTHERKPASRLKKDQSFHQRKEAWSRPASRLPVRWRGKHEVPALEPAIKKGTRGWRKGGALQFFGGGGLGQKRWSHRSRHLPCLGGTSEGNLWGKGECGRCTVVIGFLMMGLLGCKKSGRGDQKRFLARR